MDYIITLLSSIGKVSTQSQLHLVKHQSDLAIWECARFLRTSCFNRIWQVIWTCSSSDLDSIAPGIKGYVFRINVPCLIPHKRRCSFWITLSKVSRFVAKLIKWTQTILEGKMDCMWLLNSISFTVIPSTFALKSAHRNCWIICPTLELVWF